MKNTINKLLKAFAIIVLVGAAYSVSAQPPPPPGSGTSGPTSNNQIGGNAPIGGGLFILLGLGAAYGGRKLYQLREENLEE